MPRSLQGVTILVAEDNAIQAWDMKCLFEERGAVVLGPVKTVAAALSLARKASFTCGVLDVMLGQEPVYPVAHLLSNLNVGIVFCTGHSDEEELQQDFPEAKVVLKPAPSAALLDAVRLACASRRMAHRSLTIPAEAQ